MPTILPSLTSSLPPEGAIRQGSVKSAPPAFPVAIGEILEVTIGEKVGPSRYSLFWKNIQLLAAADIPLRSGEKLTVRVEQLNPGIVLRLVGQEDSASLLTGYLRVFRANPQALTEFFQKGRAVFDQQEVGSLLSETGQKTLQKVVQQLTNAAGFIEEAVKAIETQQMVNVHAQENTNKYLLQIPLCFPDGIRGGEIFIESDNNGQGEKVKNGFKVVMFLTMDRLGDIMVEVSLAGNKIGCAFKFADQEAQAFFSSFLDGLGDLLRRAGYDCHYLTCGAGENLPAHRQDFRRDILRGEEGINVYI